MFCSKCGTQLPDDAIFCSKCGTQLKASNNVSSNTGITIKLNKKTLMTGAIVAAVAVLGFGVWKIIQNSGSENDAMEMTVIAKSDDTTVEIAAGSLSKTLQCSKTSPSSMGRYPAYYLEDCTNGFNAYVVNDGYKIYSITGKCSDAINCSEKASLLMNKHEIKAELMYALDSVKKQVELCLFDTYEGAFKRYAQVVAPSCKNNKEGNGWRLGASEDYATKYVNKIEVKDGVITLTANNINPLKGETFTFVPTSGERDNGMIYWIPGDGEAHDGRPALGSPALHTCKDSGLC